MPDSVEHQAFLRFARMTEEYRRLKDREKELNGQLEALSFQLRDYLGAQSIQAYEVADYRIYLKRDVWVRAKPGMTQEIVCDALKRNGLGHFVKEQYATSSITGHITGLEDRHAEELAAGTLQSVEELLPPEVRAVIDCNPAHKVIAHKKTKNRATLEFSHPGR
jgi:hypothetical protein